MKILFLVGKDIPVAAVSEWEEIKNYKDEGDFAPSKAYFSIFKALEQNPEFEKQILLARENADIPKNGISWKDYYYNYYLENLRAYSEKEQGKFNDFFSKIDKQANRIRQELQLNPYVSRQLNYLIIGSFVFPEDFPLSYEAVRVDEGDLTQGYGEILIRISHKVTLHKLTKYIEDNWRNIEPLIESLSPVPKHDISKRDFRIVELRDKEKMKFGDIADKIFEELEDAEWEVVNEDSVKTAYGRAKEKINNLLKQTKK